VKGRGVGIGTGRKGRSPLMEKSLFNDIGKGGMGLISLGDAA